MQSSSLNQHKYAQYVAYGKQDATEEERKIAKEMLATDKVSGRYQCGYAGIICAIIKHDDKFVLLWHNKKACWVFPTGKVEPEETDEESLTREMKEELDIDIKGSTYLGHVEYDEQKRTSYRFETYRVNAFTGDIRNKEPHKHARLKYCTKVELKALIETGSVSEVVKLIIDKGWV
jgi:8-oxo-dGTP pyrophosphatase MutT (NUDIX family)